MVLKDGISVKEIQDSLKEYMDIYEIPAMFRMQFEQNCLNGFSNRPIDSQIAQFYKEYNLLGEYQDMYYEFTRIIKHAHPDLKDKTILDVGGGIVPQLGRELAKEAKHVMVIDRNMVFKNNPDNLEPIKRRIESERDLPSGVDIVVGLLPCEATQHIIDYSVSNKKDFIIALCGCWHSLDLGNMLQHRRMLVNDQGTTVEKMESYAKVKMDEAPELGDLVAFESRYNFPEDVIGNKRK